MRPPHTPDRLQQLYPCFWRAFTTSHPSPEHSLPELCDLEPKGLSGAGLEGEMADGKQYLWG